jgi:septum formation protein
MIRTDRKIILASGSPRRQALLNQLGLEFEVRTNGLEEIFDPAISPRENALRLSFEKADGVAKGLNDGIVIGVDTIVVLDGVMMGKPENRADAERMLGLLSGRKHEVVTGFTLIERPGGRMLSDAETTAVWFRKLDKTEIEEYVRSGSSMDKAGAYGIQSDMGAIFVERIEGCFFNVVGLPLTKFYLSLTQFLKTP